MEIIDEGLHILAQFTEYELLGPALKVMIGLEPQYEIVQGIVDPFVRADGGCPLR